MQTLVTLSLWPQKHGVKSIKIKEVVLVCKPIRFFYTMCKTFKNLKKAPELQLELHKSLALWKNLLSSKMDPLDEVVSDLKGCKF